MKLYLFMYIFTYIPTWCVSTKCTHIHTHIYLMCVHVCVAKQDQMEVRGCSKQLSVVTDPQCHPGLLHSVSSCETRWVSPSLPDCGCDSFCQKPRKWEAVCVCQCVYYGCMWSNRHWDMASSWVRVCIWQWAVVHVAMWVVVLSVLSLILCASCLGQIPSISTSGFTPIWCNSAHLHALILSIPTLLKSFFAIY